MNIVINKFKLPCDIKNVIYNYCYNDLGYSFKEIESLKKTKDNKKYTVLRYLSEIKYWKNTGTAVCWLRGCTRNGIRTLRYGAYSSTEFELNRLKELKEENFLSSIKYENILKHIYNNGIIYPTCIEDSKKYYQTYIRIRDDLNESSILHYYFFKPGDKLMCHSKLLI